MLTGLQFPHILLDGGASDTGVALGAHVVAKSNHHLTGLLGQLPKTNDECKIMEARIGYHLWSRPLRGCIKGKEYAKLPLIHSMVHNATVHHRAEKYVVFDGAARRLYCNGITSTGLGIHKKMFLVQSLTKNPNDF